MRGKRFACGPGVCITQGPCQGLAAGSSSVRHTPSVRTCWATIRLVATITVRPGPSSPCSGDSSSICWTPHLCLATIWFFG